MGCGSSTNAVNTADDDASPHDDDESVEPAPTSDVPCDPKIVHTYRPSIASLQIPNDFGDDFSSEALSDHSDSNSNKDYLYSTDVTLQWLLQRIADKYNHEISEEPQWIVERLNRPSWDSDYATSSVVRVTFGWTDEEDECENGSMPLPKSVVLKTPVAKELREDDEGKYHYIMFKRECNVYEWTQKFPKLVAPNIIHIKKHTKEGSGVVVMEDVSEKGINQDPVKGLTVEVVRDLLKQIAYLHATSLRSTSWNTLVADLPPSYYSHIIGNFDETMTFFERQDVDHSRFVHLAHFFRDEYLHSTATDTTQQLGIPKVLVHGEPYASNVFIKSDGKEQRVIGIIDFTEAHSGCFAEDVAKIICWNLPPKERVDNTTNLLESYHFHLARYCDSNCPFNVDVIQKAYDLFVPFAMVSLCGKLVQLKNKTEKEPLIDRCKSLIQQCYTHQMLKESNQ